MQILGNHTQNMIKYLPLFIIQAGSRLLHGLCRQMIHLFCRLASGLGQHQRHPVTDTVLLFPNQQSRLLQLRHSPGDGRLVPFAQFTQPGCSNALRIPGHHHQALGMGPFQSVFCHFCPLDLLDIMVQTGYHSGKDLIFTNHYNLLYFC